MAIDNKYHIKIDDKGFILDRGRNAVFAYQKKRAPSFVNKFGSGDSSYRDATFWQFWAQINWRNGSKQEKWGDGGRFWKSLNMDVTAEEKLQLAKNVVSAGQVEAGAKVTAMAAWRSSQSWWNASYTYRKQLTIAAPSSQALPVGYPVVVTEDTAALETATKVRSDRKDWRVVYFNGTSYTDLTRDYVATDRTVFALQAAIAAGASDSNYYLFYGYAAESTTKQPSTDADWNAVYGMYGTTPDAYSLGVWHAKEGSGTTITDTSGAYDLTCSTTTPSWATTGPFGRNVKYSGTVPQEPTAFGVTISAGDAMDVGSFTIEFWAKNSAWSGVLAQYGSDSDSSVKFKLYRSSTSIVFQKNTGSSTSESQTSTAILLDDSAWHHYAVTFDGTQTAKFYRDGTLIDTKTFTATGIRSVTGRLHFFRDQSTAQFAHIRMSNTTRTSFPYAWDINTYPITVTIDSEQTTQPPSSNFVLYAGTNTGKIYQWDGSTGWTLAFDTGLLEYYETGNDTDNRIGDTGGTEYKRAQSFKVDKDMNVKSVLAYLKATATTPSGDITVRIETNNAGVPSGTLVDSHATGTITNFSDTSYGWRTCTFDTAFKLTAATTYWMVLSVSAQANDVGFDMAGDNSSPSYTDGNAAVHNGASWSAEASKDLYFRIRSTDTSVNCFLISGIGGTQKLFIGLGAISSQTAADARIATFDGTTWAFHYTFSTDCQVTALAEFSDKLYAGVGPKAIIYQSDDATTWTQSKDIQFPQNPGYIYSLKEYNSNLIAVGGSPEYLYDKNYDGFAYIYNGTIWQSLYPFDHTVVRCMEFYDAFLFLGTYHGQIYTYNTSFLDPLFSFKDDYKYNVIVNCMKYFDDKLYIGLYPQTGITETNVGLWVFDRHGMSLFSDIGPITGVTSLEQVNNTLMIGTGDDGKVYKIDADNYTSSGYLQTSYFDSNLPSINKLWNKIELNFDPLKSGENITLAYRFKESDSWTSISPENTLAVGDTSATFVFPTGTVSKKISVIIYVNISDASHTPVITEYILRYSLFPVTKYQWSLRIKAKSPLLLADKTEDPRTGEQLRSDLEGLLSDTQLHTFTDIDGSTHTVLFNDLDESSWVINEEDTSGATVPITLIEA